MIMLKRVQLKRFLSEMTLIYCYCDPVQDCDTLKETSALKNSFKKVSIIFCKYYVRMFNFEMSYLTS